MTGIYIATEDLLSETVVERLIEDVDHKLYVAVKVGKRGNGYLRKKLNEFLALSSSIPVIMLTDLDQSACPASLIDDWRGRRILPQTFLFRVAVRETETWLLADREGFSNYSGVPIHRIPVDPENLDNPKEALLELIRRYGNRTAKAEILPSPHSTAKVATTYNQTLCGFVKRSWSIDSAVQSSNSLKRARQRIEELRLYLESAGE